jgi:DNA invertase Pin-like site-specific DNA recombinase
MEFIEKREDLEFTSEYVDDGLGGFEFDRPEFEKMIEDVKQRKIDCIVVKDLSRLGRNFQKTEEFIGRNFPKLGVRFIAVLDGFDSAKELTSSERLAVPVANLLNEYHVMETSRKVRDTLESCRRNGKCVCNKAPYGYIIKEKRFVIDEAAAETVRRIFSLKISGLSNQSIGNMLNVGGIPCPLEHKLTVRESVPGQHFKKGEKALWSSQSVRRILSNITYTGALAQGKTMSPSYRDKRRFVREPSEWSVFENAHEAIISETVFQIVADLLGRDSYSADKENYIFSSFVFCGNCGNTLIHRISEKNVYWQCKNVKCRDKRNINEKTLKEAVFETLKTHIRLVLDYTKPITAGDVIKNAESDNEAKLLDKEIERVKSTQSNLWEQAQNGVISVTEYEEMNAFYESRAAKIEFEKAEIIMRKEKLVNCIDDIKARFKKYAGMTELTRELVVTFIEKIEVENKNSVKIFFRYANFFEEEGGDKNGS